MYRTLNDHYREKFGCKVYKLAIDAGFTCPNRDGTAGNRGCIFCSDYGGGEFAEGRCETVAQQLERAKLRVSAKNRGGKFVAYFQSFSNTYGPVSHLRQLYEAAMAPEEIVGLAIGTRPDCLPEETVALLREMELATAAKFAAAAGAIVCQSREAFSPELERLRVIAEPKRK